MLPSDQTDHPIQPVDRFRADPEETLPLVELDKRFLAVDADDTASEHLETGTYQVYGHLDKFMTYVFVHTVVLGELTDEVCIGHVVVEVHPLADSLGQRGILTDCEVGYRQGDVRYYGVVFVIRIHNEIRPSPVPFLLEYRTVVEEHLKIAVP